MLGLLLLHDLGKFQSWAVGSRSTTTFQDLDLLSVHVISLPEFSVSWITLPDNEPAALAQILSRPISVLIGRLALKLNAYISLVVVLSLHLDYRLLSFRRWL